jgi:hypothetical protein
MEVHQAAGGCIGMADPNDKGKIAQGPLAQAVKGGAQVGAPSALPQSLPQAAGAQPMVETPLAVKAAGIASSVNSVILKGLESEYKEARLNAIKLAGSVGGPEIAGKLAVSSLLATSAESFDPDVFREGQLSLVRLLTRTGASAMQPLMETGVTGTSCRVGNTSFGTLMHLRVIAWALGEAGLAEGIPVLDAVLAIGKRDGEIEKLALASLAKITGVDL